MEPDLGISPRLHLQRAGRGVREEEREAAVVGVGAAGDGAVVVVVCVVGVVVVVGGGGRGRERRVADCAHDPETFSGCGYERFAVGEVECVAHCSHDGGAEG